MTGRPQLLDAEALPFRSGGWCLPRGGQRWMPVEEYATQPDGGPFWWTPTAPPGDGWWVPQGSNI